MPYPMLFARVAAHDEGGVTCPDMVRHAALVICDLSDIGTANMRMLSKMRANYPQLPIIALAPMGTDLQMQRLLAMGINDVIAKPLEVSRLKSCVFYLMHLQRLRKLVSRLERQRSGLTRFADMVGEHPAFLGGVEQAQTYSDNMKPLLLVGPPSCGKQMLAQAIHGESKRCNAPFVAVDCRRVGHEQAERELFGYGVGERYYPGKVEQAAGGTLLLQDVGVLPIAVQERVAQVFMRGTANARLICTSDESLEQLAQSGKISAGLQNLLSADVLLLPSLSARRSDIPLLAQHFLRDYAAREGKPIARFSDDALSMLCGNDWPGNISQLADLVQRCCLLAHAEVIDAGTLRLMQQLEPVNYAARMVPDADLPSCVDDNGRVKKLKSIEDEVIRFALKTANGCMTKAARSLGIGRSTLYRRVLTKDAQAYKTLPNQSTRPRIRASNTDRS